MSTFSLTEHQLQVPEKIEWILPSDSPKDPLAIIKSKSLRKFLEKADVLLQENTISYEYKTINEEEFSTWLEYYEKNMRSHGYDVIASVEWYHKKLSEGKTVEGMFFYQHGTLICSGIFTKLGDTKATFAFKASERINISSDKNSSIGAVVDYFFIREMVKQNIQQISAGRARNDFAVSHNPGYLAYKLKHGYVPVVPENATLKTEAVLNEQGVGLFFSAPTETDNSLLSLQLIKPKDFSLQLEALSYLPSEIPYQEITY